MADPFAELPAVETLISGILLCPGDCLEQMQKLADNSIDSCITDPPYHLTSIVKRFGGDNAAPAQFGTDGAYALASRGFMGKQWDGGDIAFRPGTWAAVYRVLKPGAHLLAFGGTRTYHRMACAIEDAGFEIRDQIQWLYGSGFPKSHDVSKGIDRAAGASRIGGFVKIANPTGGIGLGFNAQCANCGKWKFPPEPCQCVDSGPATDAARQWQGWGTALKPACEPIVLARKPLSEKTVAANVLKWGTGAINVDGCRVEAAADYHDLQVTQGGHHRHDVGLNGNSRNSKFTPALGRWPANVIHDGSEEVVGAFPESKCDYSDGTKNGAEQSVFGQYGAGKYAETYGDQGSAARFFYTAKADSDDRLGSKHPTVKPLDLIQYLVRLVTPKGGTVLDPFAGTGTAGEAAFHEGMKAVLIEREAEYQECIRRRMRLAFAGRDERRRESIKAKTKDKPADHGPLFEFKSQWDEMWAKPFDRPELVWGEKKQSNG